MASISLRNLTKRWGAFVAVDDQSLEVHDKEFLVLLGPSGCGKTTTMRMIAGLEEPTAGEVWIGERLVNDELPKDRDVAMVFQNYGLYPHMTVRGNIAYPLKVRGVRGPDAIRQNGCGRRRPRCSSRSCLTGGPGRSREASASASPLRGRSFAPPRCSSWTSRSRTWTRSFASPCGRSSST